MTSRPSTVVPILAVLALVALAIVLVTLVACVGGYFWLATKIAPQNRAGMTFYRYSECAFSGSEKWVNMCWFGGEEDDFQVKELYIRDADGKVHDLRSITEETAQSWVDRHTAEVLRDRAVGHGRCGPFEDATFYRFANRNLLIFHEGKLVSGCISNSAPGPFEGLEVARKADGEFLKLPGAYEDMVRVFGEPLKE